MSVDDVVIVHSTDQPRGFWKLGQVKEALVGQDGEIRGAVVQVAGRGCQATLLHHPIQLLYPLEVSSPNRDLQPSADDPSHVQQATTTSDLPCSDRDLQQEELDQSHVSQPLRRSRRVVATEARDRLLAQALSEN